MADHSEKPDAVDRQREAVQSFFAQHRRSAVLSAAGFKAKFSRIVSPEALFPVLEDSSALIIRLSRRNVVKQTISAIAAGEQKRLTGRVHRLPGEPAPDPVVVDLDRFKRTLAWIERREDALDRFLAGRELEIHDIEYEDLLSRPEETVGVLCDKLTVPFHSLDFGHESVPVKQVPDDLSTGVANFSELSDAYEGTKYAEMFRAT